MSKAEDFIENLRIPLETMFENINYKDTCVCVFAYIRDKKDKTDDEDWKIKYSMVNKLCHYDCQTIKNIINNEFNEMI